MIQPPENKMTCGGASPSPAAPRTSEAVTMYTCPQCGKRFAASGHILTPRPLCLKCMTPKREAR